MSTTFCIASPSGRHSVEPKDRHWPVAYCEGCSEMVEREQLRQPWRAAEEDADIHADTPPK